MPLPSLSVESAPVVAPNASAAASARPSKCSSSLCGKDIRQTMRVCVSFEVPIGLRRPATHGLPLSTEGPAVRALVTAVFI